MRSTDSEEFDETVVASAAPADDATVVVPAPLIEEPTVVVVKPRRAAVGLPVEEPEAEIPKDLASLMFKPPLDPHRSVRESPFPQAEHTLPKTGVRQGIPVVYGARPESAEVYSSEAAALDAQIGPPPADGFVVPAQREGLPSMVKQNRRFRAIALAGGVAVVLVVCAGLWGVAQLAFG